MAAQGTGQGAWRIGADIGGTFTDLVLTGPDGRFATCKVSSTPDRFGRAITEGIGELLAREGLAPAGIGAFAHAATIATNAIIELRGARTGLVTTAGFRDVLEMRRLRIPVLYDLQYRKPPPLVPRHLRLEVAERMGPRGQVWRDLDEASVHEAGRVLAAEGVEAVAVCLLHAYADDRHERRVAEILQGHLGPDVFLCRSAEVLPEIREYERTSTAVVNAYVGPTVKSYLGMLERDLRRIGIQAPLRIMQSNGGVMSIAMARRKPASIVESGPAAGVIAAARLARALGLPNAISFDMGGTTAKSAMVENGEPAKTTEYEVGAGINLSSQLVKGGGYPIKLPFIDVSEIGAGGGSIVTVDPAGGLSVGPRSAGAVPGPVCYGAGGTEPTFTDAVLTLGYLNPEALAGGRVRLDAGAARSAMQAKVAGPLGLTLGQAAHGVFTLATATMTRAVKAVTTYRGRDPRDFVLIAFGGNGPVAAAAVAQALLIRTVIVPPAPGVFSALGLLLSDTEQEFTSSLMWDMSDAQDSALEAAFAALESRALRGLAEEGVGAAEVAFRRAAELRYAGQAYELAVPAEPGEGVAALATRFHAEHRRTYGHGSATDPVDLVAIRVFACLSGREAALDYAQTIRGAAPPGAARDEGRRQAYFGAELGMQDTPVLSGRAGLGTEWRAGPLIVEEYDATCIVPPGAKARLDALGNIEIALPEAPWA